MEAAEPRPVLEMNKFAVSNREARLFVAETLVPLFDEAHDEPNSRSFVRLTSATRTDNCTCAMFFTGEASMFTVWNPAAFTTASICAEVCGCATLPEITTDPFA